MTEVKHRAERLMEEGFEALGESDAKRAKRIAKELKKLRHSSAFEILAQAYVAEDRPEDAVKTLEEGVGLAPTVWRLWQLLGNVHSDLERYEDSATCYRRALECPATDTSSIHLNMAIALARQEKHAEALEALEGVTEEACHLRRTAMTLDLLNSLGRHGEARALGEQAVAVESREEQDNASMAGIYAGLGRALWEEGRQAGAASEWAWKAIGLEKNQTTALWLLREMRCQLSPSARHMRLLVRGRWHEPVGSEGEPPGFYVTYEVVADSKDEAMNLIRPFEPEPVRPSLVLEECEILGDVPDQPKGVTEAPSAYDYFSWEDD